MRNPLKAVVRWWLARTLPPDLGPGDVCFIVAGDSGYKVAKVLVVDSAGIHVRIYAECFSEIPRLVNTAQLSLGTVHDEAHGIGHLPLSRAVFASWSPVRIQQELVSGDELDGYRMWQESSGGVWDD